MVPRPDGELQGPAGRRGGRRGAGQRQREGDEGRVARAGEGVTAQGLSSFAGLRVVELGVWVAAPGAAALLADWGADVIKVEPPAGDPMRSVFGSLGISENLGNPAFALDNRGKRSVVLNLREHPERQRL